MNQQKKTKPDFNTEALNTINAMYGKLPPQAVEVEEAVLGALLLEAQAVYTVSGIISEESFYKSEHQTIFRTILEISASGKVLDLLVITQKLKDNNLLEEVGGPAYITQLTRRVASAAHIEQHARTIAEKFLARVIINRFTSVINKAYEDNIDELELLYSQVTQEIDDLLAGKSGMKHISTILDETRTDLNIRQEKALAGEIQGVNTGLADLNEINNGWQKGELIIIAARPSMGKTAVSLNLFTKSAAIKNKNVCFFGNEK
jgi:replicative DNA helicase